MTDHWRRGSSDLMGEPMPIPPISRPSRKIDKLSDLPALALRVTARTNPSPSMRVPYVLALATGVVDEIVTGRIRGREPRATIDAVRMGRKKMFVTSAKAEHELGWKVVPVDEALRRAADWFRANGYA